MVKKALKIIRLPISFFVLAALMAFTVPGLVSAFLTMRPFNQLRFFSNLVGEKGSKIQGVKGSSVCFQTILLSF
jgi:hypothetical protein